MIPDFMPTCSYLPNQQLVSGKLFAYQKEGSRNLLFIQNIQHLRGIMGVWAIVKGQRNDRLPGLICAVMASRFIRWQIPASSPITTNTITTQMRAPNNTFFRFTSILPFYAAAGSGSRVMPPYFEWPEKTRENTGSPKHCFERNPQFLLIEIHT